MDGHTAIRHIVTVLGGAEAPLTVSAMARSYKHPQITDFTRIILHERVPDEAAAKEWLVEYALTKFGQDQIEEVAEDCYRLKVAPEDVRINGKPVTPIIEEKPQFAGGSRPFDPMSGIFSDNIRAKGEDDDLAGLRESMRARGWSRWFPAIRDERGVFLVGHRRLKVAQELGIDPVILDVTIGSGEAADAERLDLAILSNIEQKKLSPASRRRIAEYLYGEREWSMAKIGQALRVSAMTISTDLHSLHLKSLEMQNVVDHPARRDTLGRRASPGRSPRGEATARICVLRTLAEHPKGLCDLELSNLVDRPYQTVNNQRRKLAQLQLVEVAGKRIGKNKHLSFTWRLTEAGEASLEELLTIPQNQKSVPPPPIEPLPPAEMPATMQQRFDAQLLAAKKQLREELKAEVTAEIHTIYDGYIKYQNERITRADRIIAGHKGFMSRAAYRKIKASLHPDHSTFAHAAEALQLFSDLEDVLIKPEEPAMTGAPLPQTAAELMAWRKRQGH